MKRYLLGTLLAVFILALSARNAAADSITLAQTMQAGTAGNFEFELANETSARHAYDLSMIGLPDSLRLTFMQGSSVLSSITIDANTYEIVTLRVEVPADTSVGRYTGTISAARDDGLVLTVPLVLNIENTYAVQIVSHNLNIITFQGQEFSFNVTAANSGAAAVTDLTLNVEAPAKWIVQVEPVTVATLDAGAETLYHVRVIVPPSQMAIDQPVKLTVSSDQASSDESTLTVRVQNQPGYLIMAGLLILAAVIGVGVYFRAKGRR
jgi:uncharacterized membrane protein